MCIRDSLIIVAARPSMGKTAFALNMAMRAAVQDNVPVAIYSLEMSMDQLMMRMLCAWGKVDLGHLRRGYLCLLYTSREPAHARIRPSTAPSKAANSTRKASGSRNVMVWTGIQKKSTVRNSTSRHMTSQLTDFNSRCV